MVFVGIKLSITRTVFSGYCQNFDIILKIETEGNCSRVITRSISGILHVMCMNYKTIHIFIIFVLLQTVIAGPAFAKRPFNNYRDKIDIDGIEYSASYKDEFMFHTTFIEAKKISNNKILWKKKIYKTFMNPFSEHDVQWVLIKNIYQDNNMLVIKNEDGNFFKLNFIQKSIEAHITNKDR